MELHTLKCLFPFGELRPNWGWLAPIRLPSGSTPPYRMKKAANDIQLAAFFIGKSMTYVAGVYSLKEVRLRGCASGI